VPGHGCGFHSRRPAYLRRTGRPGRPPGHRPDRPEALPRLPATLAPGCAGAPLRAACLAPACRACRPACRSHATARPTRCRVARTSPACRDRAAATTPGRPRMSRWRPPPPGSTAILTREGFERLKTELDHLWHTVRPEVVKAITAAAAEGDRSENAEYIYRKKQL